VSQGDAHGNERGNREQGEKMAVEGSGLGAHEPGIDDPPERHGRISKAPEATTSTTAASAMIGA
jgi:hypothetical protein